jgi:hypothetical protein
MPFSASTCLTDLGTTLLGGTFNIYSNVDNYTSPFQTNVSYYQLAGVTTPQGVVYSCPYIMGNVPDGTTTIRIIDTLSKCCATIDLLSNDLCTTCDLEFDSYQTNNIGRIVAGDLIGSCDDEITEYKIFWYGPDSTTNVAFTSGYGNTFSPYDLTHPLIGINSPMVQSGEYIPVIDKVKLNGLNYSQTGETGYIQAELECFNATTVNVQPFTCDNGTVPLPNNYTHRVNFAGAAAGVTPLTLQSTFELDLTTDYFSWKFRGFNIPDSLKITFYGSAYTDPIILEYWVVGGDLGTSFINLLTFPKSADTSNYFSKVTSLTSLTRSPGDYLILEVIPNQINPQTEWDFYFTCMDTFDCDLCLYDYLNTPYKIQSSSITGITGSCSSIIVNLNLSGCTSSAITDNDIYKYQVTTITAINTTQFSEVSTNNSTGLLNRNFPNTLDWDSTSCSANYDFTTPQTCSPSNTNTIKFKKENTGPSGQGVIKMEFSSLSDLIHYKSSYDLLSPYSGTPSNPVDPNYYRYFELYIPKQPQSNPCGDGTTVVKYDIHYSSIVTTGDTGGVYTLNITMPTISDGLPPFDPCDINCQTYINDIIRNVNVSSTGVTNIEDFTTNTGSKYVRPFGASLYFVENPPTVVSASTLHGFYWLNNYLNSTVPFSGSSSPYTQIPSLSALTCNNFTSIGTSSGGGIQQFVSVYHYRVELTDPNNVKSFRILASPIVNGVSNSVFSDVVATVNDGSLTYANPSYTF